MALLQHYSPEEIAKTDMFELATFLARHSNNRLGVTKLRRISPKTSDVPLKIHIAYIPKCKMLLIPRLP